MNGATVGLPPPAPIDDWFTGISAPMLPAFMIERGGHELVKAIADRSDGRYTVLNLIQLLQSGHIQLWAAGKRDKVTGIVLSELVDYPSGRRELRMFGLTGRGLNDLVANMPVIQAWALSQACSAIIAEETRAGLELAVPGFVRAGVSLRMPLISDGLDGVAS